MSNPEAGHEPEKKGNKVAKSLKTRGVQLLVAASIFGAVETRGYFEKTSARPERRSVKGGLIYAIDDVAAIPKWALEKLLNAKKDIGKDK